MTVQTSDVPRPRDSPDGWLPLPALIADRFATGRVLQRRALSTTVTASDTLTGMRVVLKVARVGSLPRGTRMRLLHEADVLRSLSGDGLVPLVDAGEADGWFYLALPLVPGRTLEDRLRESRLAVDEALHVAIDLLSALAVVHARGVLHRDIKPSNVIVDEGAVRHATLIDFGLARSTQLDESVRDEPVGTARYMSPEQAGLVHRDVDERSDLYSVGVVLFESLTGQPPFGGATVGEVLRQHMAVTAPDLRTFGVSVPTALAQVVQRLLRKDPRDRYQSAAGALADLELLAQRLRGGESDPQFVLGGQDRRATLTEPAFVGRRDELTTLLSAAREAAAGRGGVVLVEAESGGGKSRLLDELAARAVDRGTQVLRGQSVDQAARRPFVLLEGVAEGLGQSVIADPALADRMATRLIDDRGALTAALPALDGVLGAGDAEVAGPEQYGEARALGALGRWLDVLGSEQRPAIVLLDDCQWADEPTVRLLAGWQRDVGNRPVHVLVVAAYRSEEVRAGDPLRKVSSRRLVLSPFSPNDVRGLVESMAGQVPEAALTLVTRLSSGSPFMASAVLRGVVETGALFHDGHGWRVDGSLLADVQSSREAATFLARRLDLLDAEVLALLAAAAVLGKEFDVELAAGLVSAETGVAMAALQTLRSRHVVWVDSERLHASFVHDKLREAILDRLTADQRQRLHAKAAALLQVSGGSAYELAYHYHAAGDDRAAFPYALAAAEEARARHALAAAESQYRIALDGVEPGDTASYMRVQTGLGDVLMLQGRYDEAAQCFQTVYDIAAAGTERAEMSRRLGELAFKRGRMPESIEHLQAALRSLGRRVPGSRIAFALCAVWEVLVQTMHSILPRAWIQRRSLDDADNDSLVAQIYSRLAYAYWFNRGPVPCAWAHLREMNMLERYPPTLLLAQAYSEHAPVASTLPWYSRGRAYAEKSLAIRREFGDVWGQGQSLSFYGVVLYAGSRFEEAIEKLGEAIRLLDRTGDQWEISTALWHVGFCHYRLGNTDESLAAFRRCMDNGVVTGNVQATAIAVSGMSKVSYGGVDAELVAQMLAQCEGDAATTGDLGTGEAVRLLSLGQVDAAADLLTGLRRQVRRAGIRNEYVAPILPWLLTATRRQLEVVPAYDPRERRRLLRRARVVGWQARSIAECFRNNLPHVLREQALIALMSGRDRTARRLARRGERLTIRLSMTAESTELQRVLDLAERGADRASGPAVTDAVSSPVAVDPTASLSLLDRFDTLLRSGRAIAAALTPEAVHANVRAAALELLRSESCSVLLVSGDDERGYRIGKPEESSAGLSISEELVRRAVQTRSVVVYDEEDGDPTQSIVLQHARAALAAPVFVRGRVAACWHVVNRQVSDVFGMEEMRLAEFISALAGAALENAEGFAAVEALSFSLEQRVDERTAELSVANTALRSTLGELERVNAELRRLDELKSDFVAMVSHELRSPLTSILGYCSTMVRHWDRVDDERKRAFVEIIATQSRRLTGLVNDLLEMSRIESGHLNTRLQPLPLHDVLDDVARDFAERLPGLRIVGAKDASVVADTDHLHRVLVNLVDNAIKYGAEPIEIDVADDRRTIRVAVRDSGPGVPEEFRTRLFEKFAQASSGSKRKATGTGLGLSIVRGLVDAMSGDAWYEAPADGRRGGFVVQLPRA